MSEMPDVATLTTISSNWGNQIRDRTIQRYSSVANRTTEHPTPAEGDLSYLEDNNTVWVYDGAAWIQLVPGPVTAANIASVPIEFGGTQVGTDDNTLTTTFESGASVAFTKPAAWASYQVMAWGAVHFSSGAGNAGTSEARVIIGASNGTAIAIDGPIDSPTDIAVWTVDARHTATGQTGNITIAVQYRETSGVVVATGSSVNFVAVRTS